jgi:hypothetical protein
MRSHIGAMQVEEDAKRALDVRLHPHRKPQPLEIRRKLIGDPLEPISSNERC